MNRKLAPVVAAIALACSQGALALALGDLKVRSALNEPLDAEIDLSSVRGDDLADLRASLASDTDFQRAGVERPYLLSRLRFQVEERPGGKAAIRISTRQPIREPFLNFLLELNWPQGRLVREYTVLLDPPVYAAAVSAAVSGPVVRARPESAPASTATAAVATEVAIPEPAPAPAPARVEPSPPAVETAAAPEPAPLPEPVAAAEAPPAGSARTYGPVGPRDTLWSIANRVRPDASVSTHRMMIALLRANPDAFVMDNVNALKSGYVLRIPDREAVDAVSQSEALADVRRQHALWEDYRQGIARATPEAVAAPAAPSERPREQAPALQPAVASESQARLEIVATGTEGAGGAGASESGSPQPETALLQEELEGRRQEVADLRARLAEAEALIQDLQRLVSLKDETLAALQQQALLVEAQKAAAEAAPAVAPPAGSESQAGTPGEAAPVAQESMPATAQAEAAPPAVTPAVEESVAAPAPAEPATPATPANEAPFAAAPAPAEPTGPALESAVGFQPAGSAEAPASQPSSLLGSLAGNPSVFWGGLAGLVALAGGLMSVRRRRPVEAGPAPAVADEETESVFARTTTEQTDPGRIHGASKASAASFLEPAVTVSTAEDPMAEVDVYLAYERFDQAEDLVRKAIAEYPDRDHYRLKLLEVHRGARNVQAFERDAASLRAAVGETSPLMDKARVWWSEMVPGRALLVAASAGGMAAAAAEPSVVEPGLERTLVLTPDVLKQLGASELPSVTHPAVALADDRIEVPSGDLDFDLGPAVPGDESTSESLSFDLDLGAPAGADESASVDLAQAEGEAGGGALDFELTLSPNEQAAVGPAQPSPAEPMSFDLDLAASAAGGASGAGDDTLAGTADFDLDLAPVAGGAAATPGAPAVSPGMDFTLDLAGSVRGTEGGLVEAGAAGDLGDPALASAFAEATQALDLDFATGALSVPAAAAMESLDLEPVSALSPDLADEAEGAPSQDFDLEEPLSFAAGFSADIDTIPIPNRSSPRADALLEDSAFNLEPGQTLAAAAASSLASGAQAPGAPEVAEGVEVPDLDLGPELQEMALADQPEAAGGVPEEVLVTLAAGAAAPTVAEAGFDAVEERAFAEGIDFELDAGFGETDAGVDEASLFLEGDAFPGLDEIGTKLDLARAYIDMGDTVGARGILSEVLNEGTDEQRGEAEDLLARLAS